MQGDSEIIKNIIILFVLVISVFGASCGDGADVPKGLISEEKAYLSALRQVMGYANSTPIYHSKPLLTTGDNLHEGGTLAEPYASMHIWIVAFEFGDPTDLILPSHGCAPDVDPCPPRFNARVVGMNARDGESIGGSSLLPTSPRRFVSDIPVTEEDIRAAMGELR